jgi:phosphoribosylamine--glycine ligase
MRRSNRLFRHGFRNYGQPIMRILGITETCDLGSMYLRLIAEGHEVRITVSEPLASGTMRGLIPRAGDWREELSWVREGDSDGLVLFEATGFGALQDELRKDGFQVIGGSALGDRLESDRAYALKLLHEQGLNIASTAEFTDVKAALADLSARPRRCVFKMSASAGKTFVGTLSDGRDVAALLAGNPPPAGASFILMDFVEGVETGVGAYFSGESFLRPACLDWEHKHFFAGDLGELTGEMGTVATYDDSDAIFEATLLPLERLLRAAGHVGYVNLNTIINEQGIWPIEFTCRFGYPGFAVLEPLQQIGWGDLFRSMMRRDATRFPTLGGVSVCVVMTTPPFPFSREEVRSPVGLPVIQGDIPSEHLHLGEVGMDGEQLVTTGLYGWTAVVTGIGPDIAAARQAAYAHAGQFYAPNVRYRTDIGQKLMTRDMSRLESCGWLKSSRSAAKRTHT